MKYALLGNGFDLHHNLPTKYIDFLRIFDFWADHLDYQYDSIGQLIDAYLQETTPKNNAQSEKSSFQSFYHAHREKLDREPIDAKEAKELLSKLKNSFWFSYFTEAKYEDIGWIDFESEIHSVLQIFRCIFEVRPADYKVVEDKHCPKFKVCLCETNTPHISIFEDPGERNIVVFIDKKFIFKNNRFKA